MRRLRAAALASLVCLAARLGQAEMTEIGRIPLPADFTVRFLMVSPDGGQLTAACSDAKLRVWALPPTGAAPLRTLDGDGERISAIAYSHDGTWMAAATVKGTIAVFRAGTGETVSRFTATRERNRLRPEALALGPDGSRVAIAPGGAAPELWDVASAKRLASLTTGFGGSAALGFSPDGTRLASADEDTAIRIYDSDGRLRATSEDLLLESFALTFTPEGKHVLVGGADKTVTLLDGTTGKAVRRGPKQQDSISWLAALREGRTVVSGSFKDESMRLAGATLAWPLDGAAPRVVTTGRMFNGGGPVADGRLLLTSTEDGAIVVWEVR